MCPKLSPTFRPLFSLLILLLLGACATPAPPARVTVPSGALPAESPQRSATLTQISAEAKALMPLAQSEIAQRFLRATDALPSIATRKAYRDDNTRDFFSPTAAEALPEERRKKLAPIDLDEYRYYYTKYGTPLAYMRALDLAATQGITSVKGVHILDFGYGSISHLRLLASLGAHAVGVDPDSYLQALYHQPADQGSVAPAPGIYRGPAGSVTLAHGRWPKAGNVAEIVAKGGPYQLILSKNTLKRGYLKPERRANKNQLIDLGVADEVFLKATQQALAPGGFMIIYNLAPKQSAADKPYLPHADARSPFTREQFTKAGLAVVAMDVEDHDFVRRMGAAVGWDKNDKGEVVNDLSTNLFALYTIVRRTQ